MTADPAFLFNPDLLEVDNRHSRERFISCGDGSGQQWEMDFEGTVLTGSGQTWPVSIGEMPANRRILQLSTSGSGEVIQDASDTIDDMVPRIPGPDTDVAPAEQDDAGAAGEQSEPSDDEDGDDGHDDDDDDDRGAGSASDVDDEDDSCGCWTVGTPNDGAAVATLAPLALVSVGRRRRGMQR